MNIGILGGTFDPVHRGHINIANAVCEHLNLDKVLFMPTANPPHKKQISNLKYRIEMLELAVKDHPKFEVSDFEAKRDGIIYTAETLTLLKEQNPEDSYVFIIGADSLYYIDTWYHPEIIFEKAEIAVCGRDNSTEHDLNEAIYNITSHYVDAVIHVIPSDQINIASNEIRKSFHEGNIDAMKQYIDEDVYEYIVKKGLYDDEV